MLPRRIALTLALAAASLCAVAPAASAADARSFVAGVEALQKRVSGPPAALHSAKRALVVEHFPAERAGVAYADVFVGLDCVSTAIQRARGVPAKARTHARTAQRCMTKLIGQLGTAPTSTRADARRLSKALAEIAARIKARRAFGAKATALRKASSTFVGRHFDGRPLGDTSFRAVYDDLECADVKVETGARSGASSCLKRLARVMRERLPDKPAVTFGSDLAGTPIALPGKFPEDSGFWTHKLRVPADGTIERFRLRVGDLPRSVTVRFSVVRPQRDGRVKVVTTTDPRLQVAANTPNTYTVATSSLSFRCCAVQAGDLVAVTSSGADQTESPFVWFAREAGTTTFAHENPRPGSLDQNPGVEWSFRSEESTDTLLQVVMVPS